MLTRPTAINRSLETDAISRDSIEFPLHVFLGSYGFLQTPEDMPLSIVPENSFAKDQSKRHLIDQRFHSSRGPAGPRKVGMHPRPEVAMPVSAVVSLHAKAQRVAGEAPAIERDLPGKKCIGMRRSRETNPAFVAQRDAKRGTVAQMPRDRVTINCQVSPAGILMDRVIARSKMKWSLAFAAEIQALDREALNKSLRPARRRKPRSPNLNGHPTRVSNATSASGIHQQITEPPCPASIRQSQTNKPDLISAAHRQRGKRFIKTGENFHFSKLHPLSHRPSRSPVTAVTA